MKRNILTVGLLFLILAACNAQKKAAEPYSVLDNFIPSGYMEDTKNIVLKENHQDDQRPDKRCVKAVYSPGEKKSGGVYWQYPANNWCEKKGRNLSDRGYDKITFYAKGEKGGECVRFRAGHDCGDTFVTEEIPRYLTTEWQKFTIDLSGKDLSNITGAFCWMVASDANDGTVTFYLDDIQFE